MALTGSTYLAIENAGLRDYFGKLRELLRQAADALEAEHVSQPREFHPKDCKYCELVTRLRAAART